MDAKLLRHILDRYLLPEELRELLDDHEEPTGGTTPELIDRVLAIEDLDPAEAVEFLDHRELVQVSRELGLPAEGSRDELFDRVLERVTGVAGP